MKGLMSVYVGLLLSCSSSSTQEPDSIEGQENALPNTEVDWSIPKS